MVAQSAHLEPHEASVLITDDNDGWRLALDELLRRAGFRPLQAACGEEAIEIVQSEPVDVALIDFHMPRLNGLETLRRIRRYARSLPAALMTAHPSEVPPAEVRSLEIRFVLTKPADGRCIVTVVTQLVRHTWG